MHQKSLLSLNQDRNISTKSSNTNVPFFLSNQNSDKLVYNTLLIMMSSDEPFLIVGSNKGILISFFMPNGGRSVQDTVQKKNELTYKMRYLFFFFPSTRASIRMLYRCIYLMGKLLCSFGSGLIILIEYGIQLLFKTNLRLKGSPKKV